jgi:hypothetical protein
MEKVSPIWKSRRSIAITRIQNATLYLESNTMRQTTDTLRTKLGEKDGAK